jgi:hypothetical protein
MATNTTSEFALFVDRLREQHVFAQAFVLGALSVGVTRPRPYTPTDESASATRRELGAMGVTNVPGPRKVKLTAAQRRDLEAKAQAERMGFVGGRFVGGAR